MSDAVRADVWIWSVRLFKSRTVATAQCKAGHVAINGVKAKASSPVRVGDRVHVLTPAGEKRYVVKQLITKRVSATVAAEAYVDHSPPPAPKPERPAPIGIRDRGTGRPTKRDRRALNRLRGR